MEPSIKRKLSRQANYWLFVLPILIPFVVIFVTPFFMGLGYSFFKWNGINPHMQFIGLDNYRNLFQGDADYFTSLWFTIRYAVLDVVCTNLLALALALLLDLKIPGRNLMRTVFFAPNVISAVIAGFLWTFIFNQGSQSLFATTGIGLFKTQWLGNANVALISMVMVAVWQGVGYVMIIYLAGLQSVDVSLLEAAEIDGASGPQRFFFVTLPLIMPAVTINLFMTLSQAFRSFDLNVALTNGAPGNSTLSLALDIYHEGFANNAVGYASAKAMILFVIVFTITMLQIRLTSRREVQL